MENTLTYINEYINKISEEEVDFRGATDHKIKVAAMKTSINLKKKIKTIIWLKITLKPDPT